MKYILLGILSCISLHAMDHMPEFNQIDPAEKYQLESGWDLQFLPNDFSGDSRPRHITFLDSSAVQPSIAGKVSRNAQLPIEVIGANEGVISGIDSHGDKIVLCRKNGVATFISLEGEGGFFEKEISNTPLIACYFIDDHTVVFIDQTQRYILHMNKGTISFETITEYPAIDQGAIAVRKKATASAGASTATALAPAAPRRNPMGCWKMFLWILFGRRPFH